MSLHRALPRWVLLFALGMGCSHEPPTPPKPTLREPTPPQPMTTSVAVVPEPPVDDIVSSLLRCGNVERICSDAEWLSVSVKVPPGRAKWAQLAKPTHVTRRGRLLRTLTSDMRQTLQHGSVATPVLSVLLARTDATHCEALVEGMQLGRGEARSVLCGTASLVLSKRPDGSWKCNAEEEMKRPARRRR